MCSRNWKLGSLYECMYEATYDMKHSSQVHTQVRSSRGCTGVSAHHTIRKVRIGDLTDRELQWGAPVTSRMRSSWFIVELPGKMGFPVNSSPSMQPVHRYMTVDPQYPEEDMSHCIGIALHLLIILWLFHASKPMRLVPPKKYAFHLLVEREMAPAGLQKQVYPCDYREHAYSYAYNLCPFTSQQHPRALMDALRRQAARAQACARTCRPHVHAEGVFGRAQQDFGRSVPPRGHIVRQYGRGALISFQLCNAPRKSEIRQLHSALAVEQQVARLHVHRTPSQHTALMVWFCL